MAGFLIRWPFLCTTTPVDVTRVSTRFGRTCFFLGANLGPSLGAWPVVFAVETVLGSLVVGSSCLDFALVLAEILEAADPSRVVPVDFADFAVETRDFETVEVVAGFPSFEAVVLFWVDN